MSEFAKQVIECDGLSAGMHRLANEVLDLKEQLADSKAECDRLEIRITTMQKTLNNKTIDLLESWINEDGDEQAKVEFELFIEVLNK